MPSSWLAGVGVAFSCGLNATLPLLILGLADRVSTTVTLRGPFEYLSSNAGLVILLLLLPIELVADKIPKVDSRSDIVHSVVRPLAGAIASMAIGSQFDLPWWATGMLGLAIAGTAHGYKMQARPQITVATKGFGNPYASVVEDIGAVLVAIVSIVNGWLTILVIPLVGVWIMRTYRRLISGQSRVLRLVTPQKR